MRQGMTGIRYILLLLLSALSPAAAQLDSLAPDRFSLSVRPKSVRYLFTIDLLHADGARLVVMQGSDTLQLLPLADHPQTCSVPVHCFTATDIDFDGYADLMMRGTTSVHDQSYQFWRHDPAKGRFVLDDTISGELGEPAVSRRRRELTFQHISVTGDYQSWSTYRLVKGRFTLVQLYELERLDGVHSVRTITRVRNGQERIISRRKVREGW
jgi:hypothetical protein